MPEKTKPVIPISYWFEIKDITFFFKCKVGYFDLKLEDYVVQPPHHQTRFSSANTLRPNLCRTSFRNFYFNRVVLMWNNLPSIIKLSLTFSSLKSKLYYYVYDTLLAVVSELRRNHCEQTNDLLSSMREDHVMGSH
jgi:hypothetical protein